MKNTYPDAFWTYRSLRSEEQERFTTSIKLHDCPAHCHPHTPQFTDVYQNSDKDRFYIARDMGWANPFWSIARTNILAKTLNGLGHFVWDTYRIPYAEERAFLDYHLNAFKLNSINPDWFVIRENRQDEVMSVVWMSRFPALMKWPLRDEPTVDYNYCPIVELCGATHLLEPSTPQDGDPLTEPKRWVFSDKTRRSLSLVRMQEIILLSEMGSDSDMVKMLWPGMPEYTKFAPKITTYLSADPVLEILEIDQTQIPQLFTDASWISSLPDRQEIEDTHVALRTPLADVQDWKWIDSYDGVPSDIVHFEAKKGHFKVSNHVLWAVLRCSDDSDKSSRGKLLGSDFQPSNRCLQIVSNCILPAKRVSNIKGRK